MQVKPQPVVASHVALAANCGTGQAVHNALQEFTLVLLAQVPLQSWLPDGHTPLQDCALGMQTPAHSFWLTGQLPPHWPSVPSPV
jgi:hypothetical protein